MWEKLYGSVQMVHIFMTKADQSIEHELLAEGFYVAEYEEYWLTPGEKKNGFS